jgi:far upstream element-binding protein
MVGVIIGRGGDNLKKIERNSGARVQIDQGKKKILPLLTKRKSLTHPLISLILLLDSGESERQVTLTGEDDQIQLARDMIQQIVRDSNVGGYDASSYGGDGAESQLTVTVPSHRVGLVIGRGGETIRDLEQRSGAKIKVLPEKSGDHPSERTVAISGNKGATEKAKMMVEDIVNSQPSQVQQQQQKMNASRGDPSY